MSIFSINFYNPALSPFSNKILCNNHANGNLHYCDKIIYWDGSTQPTQLVIILKKNIIGNKMQNLFKAQTPYNYHSFMKDPCGIKTQ